MTADVVIIGGGVMGCSIAYHLARDRCRVVVVEREPNVGAGSTGRCSGGVRHQFSDPVNVGLSIASIRKLKNFEEEVGYPIDLRQDGYVFLLTRQDDCVAFAASVAMQQQFGVGSELLPANSLRELVPDAYLDDVIAGAYCPEDGLADPHGVTLGYARKARQLGARIMCDCTVMGIKHDHSRVTGVVTDRGEVATGVVINAAGPWAGLVGTMAGVDIPVQPVRRHVFVTYGFEGVPPHAPDGS